MTGEWAQAEARAEPARGKPRARELGLPLQGETGPANGITDVKGVEVGYTTLLGEGPDRTICTGVTVVMPRGREGPAGVPVWAGFHALNGNGEMTGTHWIREAGWFLGPIGITNTHSVGIVHHALARYMAERTQAEAAPYPWLMPVAAETCDGYLNDMNGFHVAEEHVRAAIANAQGGRIAEGNVGGGTGMICYEFKGGTGTASRVVGMDADRWVVGALVQANFGLRPWLRVLGVPVGEHLDEGRLWPGEQGSVIVVVATDAPLLPNQLERLARRAALGVGRTGTPSGDGSGDLCLAFSTANGEAGASGAGLRSMRFLPHHRLDPLFEATAQVVEEAVLNALLAADGITGRQGRRVEALDHAALLRVMSAYGRVGQPTRAPS